MAIKMNKNSYKYWNINIHILYFQCFNIVVHYVVHKTIPGAAPNIQANTQTAMEPEVLV